MLGWNITIYRGGEAISDGLETRVENGEILLRTGAVPDLSLLTGIDRWSRSATEPVEVFQESGYPSLYRVPARLLEGMLAKLAQMKRPYEVPGASDLLQRHAIPPDELLCVLAWDAS